MSSLPEHQPPSSSQFIPPESAQPFRSLFGGPSSDVGPLPSSQPEPTRRSIFGGPGSLDAVPEPETEAELMELGETEEDEDELDMIMRERPLAVDYGSDGESFKGSDEEEAMVPEPTNRAKTKPRRQPSSPAKVMPSRTTYVLDRGLDLPPGVERPNRWTGNPTTYRRVTAKDREVYEGLLESRARDLAAHLYNSYTIRTQSKRAPEASQDPGDASGQENFTVPKRWGAWPMPPSRVPRPDETARQLLDDPDTLRMPPDPRPSAELEESIIASMMKIAKENFTAREWDFDELKNSRAKKTDDPDAMTDDEKKEAAPTDATFLRPVIQADDDISRRQLRPLARNVITQVDRLLMGLHRSMKHRVQGGDSSCDSATEPEDDTSRSRSKRMGASRSQSRGRKRARRRSRNGSPAPQGEDQRMHIASHSRGRSRTSRNSDDDEPPVRSKLALRDWSEVMGLASMIGLPSEAVMRASKRCADLFGQDMTFRNLHEGRIEKTIQRPDSTWEYAYVESATDDEKDVAPPPRRKRKPVSRARSQSQSQPSRFGPAPPAGPALPSPSGMAVTAPESSRNASASLNKPRSRRLRGKGDHRKADIVCPIKRCARHEEGFSRTWNLTLHMKRVHPGYNPHGRERSKSQSAPKREGEVIQID